jgi:hypothetical protein
MKTVGRILIILAAAMVVVGATLAITNSSSSTQSAASAPPGEEFRPRGERHGNLDAGEALVPGQRPEGFGAGSRPDHDERGGAFVSVDLIKNLVIIAGVVLVVTLLERLLKTRHRRKTLEIPPSQA